MPQSGIPYFKAWVIFTIASVGLAVLGGMGIGFILGMIMGILGLPIETIQLVCGLAGMVVGLVASYAMFRWVVDRFVAPAIGNSPLPANSGLREY